MLLRAVTFQQLASLTSFWKSRLALLSADRNLLQICGDTKFTDNQVLLAGTMSKYRYREMITMHLPLQFVCEGSVLHIRLRDETHPDRYIPYRFEY